ncbi:hypothetical protein PHMEG_00034080 [Phytophthora megakarya]|uniref:Peptidase A2 domain-containing protein n=1 Tax=Phytophthora megakarya TaxID=4795 RepID=A0A225URU7_9STRA|nr:hypothetical protein PHMEG_00034080 [Phytophthora megakarya]
MELELLPRESRGYWKYHAPGKWFKQAKSTAKINNEKATLLFDSGAEVSIVDSTFARKVGCAIDDSQKQECVGIGENAYMTEGRTRIKITLAGAYVYYFDAWVGDLSGQEAILGMDFMVPAGIRLDMADGSLCLPDEVRIQLSGRNQLFCGNSRLVTFDQHHRIPVAGSVEIAIRRSVSDRQKLWVTRFVSIGSRRYAEWQNLSLQATTEQQAVDEVVEVATEPMVDRPRYEPPTKILADIENNMAVLPEVEATTKEVTIDDIQMDDPHATPEEHERLRRIIWKRRHLLIVAGNALPLAAFGAICDIDVGTAKPVAQRCRRVAPQFREKLSMLIKGMLSAKIITTSTSP